MGLWLKKGNNFLYRENKIWWKKIILDGSTLEKVINLVNNLIFACSLLCYWQKYILTSTISLAWNQKVAFLQIMTNTAPNKLYPVLSHFMYS